MFKSKLIDSQIKPKASRLAFGEELLKLGEKDDRIVALDADLSKSTCTNLFAEKFPKRFFNMGIAEANMIGTAAGLANSGMIPYAASFACFLTGRFDTIRMSVSFSETNVRLVGTHAGVGIGEDGHSQMGLEDLTLMRVLPNMTVFQPGDEADTVQFMRWSVQHVGPIYMRLTRQGLPALKRTDSRFAPGKWDILEPVGAKTRVVLLATGGLMAPSIDAADLISAKLGSEEGLVSVVNANWIQPFDEVYLAELAQHADVLVVTLEDHYRKGGLGGTVAEFFSGLKISPRLLRIGVDGFGQSGTPEANYQHYGFTPEKIAEKVLSQLGS